MTTLNGTDIAARAIQAALDGLAVLRRATGEAVRIIQDPNGDLRAATPAGRLVVAPGQSISSAWGNTVYDQSVICFNNNADRDNQWTAPHAGSMCYTLDTRTLWQHDGTVWNIHAVNYATERVNNTGQAVSIGSRAWGNVAMPASAKGNWTTATGLITATRAGTLYVGTFITYPDAGGAISMLGFKHNGLDVGGGAGVNLGGGALQLRGSYATPVAVGDTIGVQIYNMVTAAATFTTATEIVYQGG